MPVTIRPITERDIDGFREALGSVAREKRWLLFTDAPDRDKTEAFVRSNIDNNVAQLVAIGTSADDRDRVVGWCDICPMTHPGTTHRGHLGMGVVETHRGQGIGTRLIEATIEAAIARGISRIELEAFSSNTRAIRLYEKLGFEHEGVKRRARCLDGHWDDFIVMALLKK